MHLNGHSAETIGDLVDLAGLDPNLIKKMKRTTYTNMLEVSDIQPIIDIAVRYKILEKGFPASELISDAAVR